MYYRLIFQVNREFSCQQVSIRDDIIVDTQCANLQLVPLPVICAVPDVSVRIAF